MNKENRRASSLKSENMRVVLVLPIYVQSVRLAVGDDGVGEWNR